MNKATRKELRKRGLDASNHPHKSKGNPQRFIDGKISEVGRERVQWENIMIVGTRGNGMSHLLMEKVKKVNATWR